MAPTGAVPRQSVGRLKGKPLIGQARGQLRPTCVFHAEYAHSVFHNSLCRRHSTHPGGASRSRIEPCQPRAAGPAAGSTLARVSGRQPSGIQPSAVLPHQLIISRSDFLPQSADTPAHRHHRDPFPSGFPYWYGNRSCLRPPARKGSPWFRTSWHRCRRRREPL